VLLVEDNHQVREGLARVLSRAGFNVTTAENGLEALARLEGRQFEAVVSDIMMPVMDGMRLYQVLEVRYPEAARRLLFVSAWFDDPEVQAFLRRSGRPVLQKPFEIEDLIRRVRELAA
jgi:CheY-like chemotaxis protein